LTFSSIGRNEAKGYEDKVNQIEALYETIEMLECKLCDILNLLEE
jgi:hypothetical protein